MGYKFKLSEYMLTEDYINLCEMAYSRSDAIEYLEASEYQRVENLIQIFVLGGNAVNHWCNELYACCHENYKLKGKNRQFTRDELLSILWYGWRPELRGWLKNTYYNIADKEGLDELPEFDEDKLMKFMGDYHVWLATQLSRNQKVTNAEVKSEITELLKLYK